jgi:DNA-3-methyladenine glycosylase I
MFERITLEAFQAGLSWLVILRKRDRLRLVFADFEVATVAGYDEGDVARLLTDPGIVRNKAKIEATIANARAAGSLDEPLAELVWRFAPTPRPPRPDTMADIATRTPESTALAAELRRRGFRFVGPTTAYALMQATGMVDDHLAGCAVLVDDEPASTTMKT